MFLARRMGFVMAGVLAALAAYGQTFEVASVRPADPSQRNAFGVNFLAASGRLTARSAPPYLLILRAYDLRDFQLSGGPDWLRTEQYDVEAKAAGPSSEDELKKMLQTLLAARFQLKFRRETKEISIYALTVAKGGPKLPAAKDDPGRPGTTVGRGRLTAHNTTMAMLVSPLSRLIGTPVEDATGLNGSYDFTLQYDATQLSGIYATPAAAPGALPDVNGPSLFSAVQEQLGLKLELRKVPKETLIVDSASRPSDN